MVKVVYQGPAKGIRSKEGGEVYAKGATVELEQNVIDALTRQGHRFADPKETKEASKNGDKAEKKE